MNPNQILAQPYYGDKKIRFYKTTNPVASAPVFTLDLSSDITGDLGPNSVVVHNSKIFVAVANGNGDKGLVLIYNYADFYPTKVANASAVLKFGLANGLSAAGMAINPTNGDLYIPTFHVSGADGGIYVYSAASNYATLTHFADFNDPTVAEVCANLAFDGKGNLWMTTWSPDNDPTHHFLICYKGLNKNTAYKITNAPSKAYTATDVTGATISVHLLSAPEGIAFDPSGNLWLGNNNDFALTNNPGEGTLVKISAGWINGTLLTSPTGTFTVPVDQVDIKYIPAGKPGGLLFDETTLFLNDQGQNQGASFTTNGTVWKWDVTTPFNSSNFTPSGIHTTYPGNGGASLLQPFLVMADVAADKGTEPDTLITQPWQSLDITISGDQPNQLVTVGVMVRNNGMMNSAGTENLKLYWAKASAGLYWPAPWDDTVKDATGETMGRSIGTQTLPVISAGGSYKATFAWTTPDPSKYTVGDGHFCLLARIESSSTPPYGMTFPELTNQIVNNALNNSRIAWRNIHIVNPVTGQLRVGDGVILANYTAKVMDASLRFELLGADGKPMDTASGRLLLTALGRAEEEKLHDHRELESLGNGVFQVSNISRGIANIRLEPGAMMNLRAEFVTDQRLKGAALRVTQSEQTDGLVNIVGGQTFVYGQVAGFPSTKPGRTGGCSWRWLWIAGLFALLVALLGDKRCCKNKCS